MEFQGGGPGSLICLMLLEKLLYTEGWTWNSKLNIDLLVTISKVNSFASVLLFLIFLL